MIPDSRSALQIPRRGLRQACHAQLSGRGPAVNPFAALLRNRRALYRSRWAADVYSALVIT